MPAKVETAPPGVILRIVLLPVSLTNRFPFASNASPLGVLNCALVPWPFTRAGNAELSGKSCHHAVRRDFADGVVLRIGHEEISVRVRDNGRRIVEQRVGAGAVGRAADERLSGQRRHRILRAQRERERETKSKWRTIFSLAPAHQSFVVGRRRDSFSFHRRLEFLRRFQFLAVARHQFAVAYRKHFPRCKARRRVRRIFSFRRDGTDASRAGQTRRFDCRFHPRRGRGQVRVKRRAPVRAWDKWR